jgi:hypothetical protein
MTEYQLFQALRPLYPAREYALLPQVANGTGGRATRHCDALALSLWPSRGLHLSGFEMKSHRSDWLREIKNPAKADEIAKFCNFWWIVVPSGIVKLDELPEPWGLLVWDEKKEALNKVKAAKWREAVAMDMPFMAAALRKAQDCYAPDAVVNEARAAGVLKGREDGKLESQADLRRYRELEKRVLAFEKASGVEISGWQDAESIGDAVKQVLSGTVNHGRDRLLRIAKQLVQELSS